ncbi:MAG TPA: glycosyltransferase [Candidatus Omnitrophota bacterium]|nr:glycosyltransferase [Candidatus Omnitrophota bacterium]
MTKAEDISVAFYVYPTAFQSPGGGEILLLKTKEFLEKEGARIKLFDPWHDQLENFDILHTFGSVKDALPMMQAAKRAGIKNVLSTICWYNLQSAIHIHGSIAKRSGAILRHAAKSLFPMIPSSRKHMMELADLLLPNSRSEAAQLQRYFGIPKDKITVIPNAVDPIFESAKPDLFINKFGFKDFILCVGRIEPRKNQLGMVRALNGSALDLVLIGDPVKAYPDYYKACRDAAGPNIHFVGGLPHDSELLRSAYAACNVFLLASWLETPGLAALEAGLAGAKVVITREGATQEYFSDYADYVNPADPHDIRRKVEAAFSRPRSTSLRTHIRENFLWHQVAKKNLESYRLLLQNTTL